MFLQADKRQRRPYQEGRQAIRDRLLQEQGRGIPFRNVSPLFLSTKLVGSMARANALPSAKKTSTKSSKSPTYSPTYPKASSQNTPTSNHASAPHPSPRSSPRSCARGNFKWVKRSGITRWGICGRRWRGWWRIRWWIRRRRGRIALVWWRRRCRRCILMSGGTSRRRVR